MSVYVLAVLLGLQTKHFIADYLLQFDWMVAEKGDMRRLGGYAHAGMHVLGSGIVLLLAQVQIALIVVLLIGEFVIHFALDFGKVYYSKDVTLDESPQKYFALHGFDQYMHHLTYLAMTYLAFFTHLP